ncbi:MAG: SRPBCC domain-containing protein [Gammaproteobacteria bacterium]|nr:SRPBCC domain-containing protein [Gammaproteobacteria bacterium]
MKKVILTVIGILALAYLTGAFTTQTLYTDIDIDAPPKVVWDHLTDFDRYPQWNPFMRNISGDVSAGSQLSVTIQPPGKDAMQFSPRLLVVKENEELRWLGRVLLPKLFDGEHYFIIETKPDGSTHLIQGEFFTGILALILWSSLEQDTKKGFEAMNQAIKTRSEASG